MKKMKVLLASVLTLVMCLFCLVGCGSTGTYKFQSLTTEVMGFSKTVEAGDEYEGEKIKSDYATVELKSDNTAVITIDETTYNCDWTESEDGEITFKQAGLPFGKATIDGSKMTLKVDFEVISMTIVLKKGLF